MESISYYSILRISPFRTSQELPADEVLPAVRRELAGMSRGVRGYGSVPHGSRSSRVRQPSYSRAAHDRPACAFRLRIRAMSQCGLLGRGEQVHVRACAGAACHVLHDTCCRGTPDTGQRLNSPDQPPRPPRPRHPSNPCAPTGPLPPALQGIATALQLKWTPLQVCSRLGVVRVSKGDV